MLRARDNTIERETIESVLYQSKTIQNIRHEESEKIILFGVSRSGLLDELLVFHSEPGNPYEVEAPLSEIVKVADETGYRSFVMIHNHPDVDIPFRNHFSASDIMFYHSMRHGLRERGYDLLDFLLVTDEITASIAVYDSVL